MKAILLPVGIDSNYGTLSPVHYDNSFSYIPIYYKEIEKERKEKRTYKSLDLSHAVPDKLVKKKVHLDPEFESFTYGDQGNQKSKALLKLNKGDLLVFYFEGRRQSDPHETGCFIFAYFVVKYVVEWNNLSSVDRKKYEKVLKNNAHFRSSKPKDNLVIVKGYSKSKLFKKCIPITVQKENAKNPYCTSPEMQKFLGIKDHITSSVPVEIEDPNKIRNLRMMLGIDPVNPKEFEEKIPLCLLSRIIDRERHLTADEKLFFMNFMISKSHDYRSDAENFGTDMYIAGFRNVDVLDEYFVDYYYKI
ncbi:MAG: hypothetical protein WBC65_04035 [Ignavibacteria bacterium]